MDLSIKDRIILINQYEILKKLEPEKSEKYSELIKILEYGYKIFYDSISYIDIEGEMDEVDSGLVIGVLSFYRIVHDYIKNNPDDLDIAGHDNGYFRGFDGNNEINCLSFVKFLIEKQNKFTEQIEYKDKTDNFNSHMQLKWLYQKMIKKWEELGKKFDLSKDDILTILNV